MTPHEALALSLLAITVVRWPRIARLLLGRPVDADAPRRAPDRRALLAWAARALGTPTARAQAGAGWRTRLRPRRARLPPGRHRGAGRSRVSGAAAPRSPTRRRCSGCAARHVLARPAVAIVGSRAASPTAWRSPVGWPATSRRADWWWSAGWRGDRRRGAPRRRGCRRRHHRGAGLGPRRLYPAEHERARRGGWPADGARRRRVPAGHAAAAVHFPRRNRIISGLVARGGRRRGPEKSGSLITAACALEQGRTYGRARADCGPAATVARTRSCATAQSSSKPPTTAAELGWGARRSRATGAPALAPAVVAALGLPPETLDFTVADVTAAIGAELPQAVLGRAAGLGRSTARIQRIGSAPLRSGAAC